MGCYFNDYYINSVILLSILLFYGIFWYLVFFHVSILININWITFIFQLNYLLVRVNHYTVIVECRGIFNFLVYVYICLHFMFSLILCNYLHWY